MAIRMGRHSTRPLIWFTTFRYDQSQNDYIKANVQGVRWSNKNRMWTAPLEMDTAREIRAVARHFGGKCIVEPELHSWAMQERERIANLLRPDAEYSDFSAMLPVVQRDHPALWRAMLNKPWQIPGAAFMAEQRVTLLGDKPGLGKTIQVLATVAELQLSKAILVIAPKTAVSVTWPEEITQWLGPNERVFSINADVKPVDRKALVAQAKALSDAGQRVWVLAGPDYVRVKAELDDYGNYLRDEHGDKIVRTVGHTVADLFRMTFSCVVVDESQNTLATKTGNKKRWSAQRTGIGALELEDGAVRIAMSGTPFRGKTEMIWGTLNWLMPKKYTSYWKWAEIHYGVEDAFHSDTDTDTHKVQGEYIKDEQRFFQELRPILVRRTYDELRKRGYPIGQKFYGGTRLVPDDEASPVGVWLPMTKGQERQYKSVVDDAVIVLNALTNIESQEMVNGSLAEMVRLKQIANSCLGQGLKPNRPSNKIDWIINFCKDRISNGTKVIVASQFTQFIELLSMELGNANVAHYQYTGKTSGKDRARIKAEFQSDAGDMVILLNTDSGGLSLTLDAADDVVIADQKWIPDDQEQVEHRALRGAGRPNHNITVWNLCSLGTIDEHIAKINAQRESDIFSIIDGKRGVEFVKQLCSMIKGESELTN